MSRKLFILCMAVILMASCVYAVSAEEALDYSKTGSFSVTLTEQKKKEPIVGAELSVYYIATVKLSMNGKLSYIYTEEFENSGIAMEDPELVIKLDDYISQQTAMTPITMTTDREGRASCENLTLGLYFVRQTGLVDGFAPCTPFLVTVPSETADGYAYEVNATPKTEVARLTTITVKKVWNTDASTEAAEYITVQLLRDGKVVKMATLSALNNWQYTFEDMPEDDGYKIREVDVPKGFKATYSQTGYIFTVTNTSTLIQTGQLIWPIPVLAIAGMLLLAAGIVLLQKKRVPNA